MVIEEEEDDVEDSLEALVLDHAAANAPHLLDVAIEQCRAYDTTMDFLRSKGLLISIIAAREKYTKASAELPV
jgi:hypothetical protein